MDAESRREHLDFAARWLRTTLEVARETGLDLSMVLRVDGDEGYNLMTLTPQGTWFISELLSSHDCTPEHDGKRMCPVLWLAWVIEGCQQEDETARDALKRNEVRVRKPNAQGS